METYNGHVRTPNDAIILFEACRLGLLPRVQRRLSEKERQAIRSGSVFVWDEREAGMRRWTDGKSWSASRVSGSFLTYREMEGKRGGSNFVSPVSNGPSKTPESNGMDEEGEEGPDGYRYKPDGLMKQSFSLTTSTGQHLHLISYFSRAQPTAQLMRQPSNDPSLASIQIPKGMYPESTIADASNTPAVTRSPMAGAPNYVMATGAGYHRAAAPPAYLPGFMPHPYMYHPISPLHTPPGYPIHPAYLPGYYHPAFGAHPLPPHLPMNAAPPPAYDQRPLRGNFPAPKSPPRHGQSMPNVVGPYPADKPVLPPTNTQAYPITPGSERGSAQLDPRLSESYHSQSQATSQQPRQSSVSPPREPPQYTGPALNTAPPLIDSLVNAAAQARPLPPKAPAVSETAVDRDGSESPGGTRRNEGPKDIPSEKLAFREDKMALSKLDRVFARV